MSKEKRTSVSEFKAYALRFFEEITTSGITVVITKRGKPIARVEPYRIASTDRPVPGKLSNTLVFEKDILTPIGSNIWSATK